MGTIVSSALGSVIAARQRKHEIRLKQLADKQHLRDARFERLHTSFHSAMLVVADLERLSSLVETPGSDVAEKDRLRTDVEVRIRELRADLRLDRAGKEIGDQLQGLLKAVERYESMLGEQAALVASRDQKSADFASQVRTQRTAVSEQADQIIRSAQRVLDELAQPVATS